MTRRLLIAYLSITAFALVMVVIPLGLTFASRERAQFEFALERDAQAIASRVEEDLENGTTPDLTKAFAEYDVDGGRIVVTNAAGISVADSGRDDIGRDFSTRPETEQALAGERSIGKRRSETLDVTLVYVAIPVASTNQVLGTVRVTVPTTTIDQRVQNTWLRLGALSALVLATVGVVGLILARGVTRPVRQVEEAARQLAAGDLSARAGEVRGPPEIADLARQFDATAERLEHQVESQQRFVADASHQLRTPLTALRLRLETLEPSADDEPRVHAALTETDRLSRLVQSLLVIARSDSAQPVLADVDLRAIADERVEAIGTLAGSRPVSLQVHGPKRLLARAVAGGTEQMLENLMANAIAAAPPHSTITVELHDRSSGGATLTVTDEGPGMTAEQRTQATSRFWRATGNPTPGSGLGLAIVDHLALSGGGRLELHAGPNNVGLRAVLHFEPPAGPAAATPTP